MTRELSAEHICLTNRFKRLSIVHASSGIVCLLGANGAGKSSLLEVLAGLTPATEGEVLWGGQPTAQRSLAELAVERGYLAQKPSIQFELTGRDCLQFFNDHTQQQIPGMLIEKLGLTTLLDKVYTHMSGGEQQRIFIARTLLQVWQPLMDGNALLILDEPLQSLDIRHQHALMCWLADLGIRGNQIVMSCHDVNIANTFADTVWLARSGELLASGPVEEVMTLDNLWRTFDCHFDFLEREPRGVFVPVSV